MRGTTVSVFLLISGWALAGEHPEFPLWANGAPGSEGKTAREVDEPPNKEHGHRFLNFDREGMNVAEYLNSIAVAGFVLKYRWRMNLNRLTMSKSMP